MEIDTRGRWCEETIPNKDCKYIVKMWIRTHSIKIKGKNTQHGYGTSYRVRRDRLRAKLEAIKRISESLNPH